MHSIERDEGAHNSKSHFFWLKKSISVIIIVTYSIQSLLIIYLKKKCKFMQKFVVISKFIKILQKVFVVDPKVTVVMLTVIK